MKNRHPAGPVAVLSLVIAFLILHSGSAAAEEDPGGFTPLSWGFKGGLSIAQHQGTEPREFEYTVSSSTRQGVAAGLFLVLPVTPRFGIQQEVLYVQKGSRQEIGVEIFEVPAVLDVTYDMDYIEIPVMMRYSWILDRSVDLYTLAGFAFGIMVDSHYTLSGVVDDGVEQIPVSADDDMSEVDMFDFAFTYGVGVEIPWKDRHFLLEYRFDLSVEALPLPTYAYVPFGDDQTLVDNEPVPLRNQAHMIMVGLRF